MDPNTVWEGTANPQNHTPVPLPKQVPHDYIGSIGISIGLCICMWCYFGYPMTIDYGYRPFSPRLRHVDPVAVDGLKSHDGIEPQRNVASNCREINKAGGYDIYG